MRTKCNSNGISTAVKSIKNGGIVIFPTDTVYGIGCDPYNKESVQRIYKIKNREKGKLFPVLGFSINDLSKIATFDENAKKIVKKFWPGQITLILPLIDKKLKTSMNLKDKIAVRIPDNDCILAVLEQCKLIIGTSANMSGQTSFFDPDECEKNMSNYDVLLDGGKISSKGDSTIVEISQKGIEIHRIGCIPKEEILNLF